MLSIHECILSFIPISWVVYGYILLVLYLSVIFLFRVGIISFQILNLGIGSLSFLSIWFLFSQLKWKLFFGVTKGAAFCQKIVLEWFKKKASSLCSFWINIEIASREENTVLSQQWRTYLQNITSTQKQ